jgi:cerevisin
MYIPSLLLLGVGAYANPLLRTGTIHHDAAPLLSSTNAKHIPNSYIVKLKPHVRPESLHTHHAYVTSLHDKHETLRLELRKRSQIPFVDDAFAGLKHTFNIAAGSFLGYSGHFDEAVIEELRYHPDVSGSCQPLLLMTCFDHN